MIVVLQGGLANQLWQYCFGRSVSIARDEELFFEKRIGGAAHCVYSLHGFNTKVRWAENTTGPRYDEPAFRFDPNVYSVPRGTVFWGWWQTSKYFDEPVLREDLKIIVPMSALAENQAKDITSSPSAFIHVRRGDYLKEPHASFHGNLTMDYYGAAVEMIRNQHKDVQFFVFSDDPSWCRMAFPSNFMVVDGTNKYEDLWLMSLCDHAIIANSSYSWFGAWLGDEKPNRTVIAPKHWFKASNMSYEDVVPDRWIKL